MFEFKVDKKITLKLLKMTDAEHVYKLMDNSREYMREWLPWVDSNTSVEDSKNFIETTLKQYANDQGFVAGIWYKGELAGIIGIYSFSYENKSSSIGYWLGEAYQGKGIMTKSCKAVINYLFNDLKFNRVVIRTATKNKKSASIPKRLGFKQEGIARQSEWLYDHYVDHIVNAMLAEEWKVKGFNN